MSKHQTILRIIVEWDDEEEESPEHWNWTDLADGTFVQVQQVIASDILPD